VKRREFIAGLGATVGWPLVARAQQGDRMRRVGVLLNVAEDGPNVPVAIATIEQGLRELNWIIGRNIQIDYRFGAGDPDLIRKYAAELVALAPGGRNDATVENIETQRLRRLRLLLRVGRGKTEGHGHNGCQYGGHSTNRHEVLPNQPFVGVCRGGCLGNGNRGFCLPIQKLSYARRAVSLGIIAAAPPHSTSSVSIDS